VQRLWVRNLGRDDRLYADRSREVCASYAVRRLPDTQFRSLDRISGYSRVLSDVEAEAASFTGRRRRPDPTQARFPFLDEEVMGELLAAPLWACVDPRLPRGVGEKVVLRKVRGGTTAPSEQIQPASLQVGLPPPTARCPSVSMAEP
jgi:hypothetical protein